jgi:hypothetical protein
MTPFNADSISALVSRTEPSFKRGINALRFDPQGPTIVGTGNGTLEVPELPSAWVYSWATLSPGVINTER